MRLYGYLLGYFLHKLFKLIEHRMSERQSITRIRAQRCKESSTRINGSQNPLEVRPLKLVYSLFMLLDLDKVYVRRSEVEIVKEMIFHKEGFHSCPNVTKCT